jgi:tripartite-type tricarboxylate transporter receptor subunit TctC
MSIAPYCLLVKEGSGVNSVKDLIKKGTVKFATSGIGAASWVNTVVFSKETGIKPKFVHFTSATDAILSVMREDTEALLMTLSMSLPYDKSGDIKILATFGSAKGIAGAEDIPSISELGYPQLSSLSLGRVVAAAPNTPPKIVKILEDAFWKSIHDPELIAQLKKAGKYLIGSKKGEGAKKLMLDSKQLFLEYADDLKKSVE